MNSIKTVSIIGSGNVATTLAVNLLNVEIDIVDIYSRNMKSAKLLADKSNANHISSLEHISLNSDLYIIAISDDNIGDVVQELPNLKGIVTHTSGSQPMNLLARFENHGIFYPLQTITSSKPIKLTKVPICIESNNNLSLEKLLNLGNCISTLIVKLDSKQRLYLHLTAVMVNNFSNFLYGMAHEILEDKNIDFKLLLPLINETAKKVVDDKPHELQTGPARRNDQETIEKHLELLEEFPEYQTIYELLSKKIIDKYHE